MAKIPEYYNVGDKSDITLDRLLVILEDIYKDLAVAINKKPDFFVRDVDGQAGDTNLPLGSINVNSSGAITKIEMLTEHQSTSAVTWTEI